jgi:NADH-quinone oxidoreductase subunit L
MAHIHESPWVMLGPLVPLALGAILAGAVGYNAFVDYGREAFWGDSILVLEANDSVEAAHHVALWVKLLPLVMALSGIALAWLFYMKRTDLPKAVAGAFAPLYRLFFNKWYFDEIYDFVFVRGGQALARILWKGGDVMVIDGLGPNGVARAARLVAQRTAKLQTGYVYHYAFAMLIGVVVLISWYLYAAG